SKIKRKVLPFTLKIFTQFACSKVNFFRLLNKFRIIKIALAPMPEFIFNFSKRSVIDSDSFFAVADNRQFPHGRLHFTIIQLHYQRLLSNKMVFIQVPSVFKKIYS